jgi:hypothetical protein
MGGREAYLDLIHYRAIVMQNWPTFGPVFAYGKVGNKEKRTEWLARVNEIRKIAMHASRGATVTFEQLSELGGYLDWLRARVAGQPVAEGDVEAQAFDDAGGEGAFI